MIERRTQILRIKGNACRRNVRLGLVFLFCLSLAVLMLIPTVAGAVAFDVGTFKPWNGYAMPNGVWLTGDFNGDGRTDIVHVVNRKDYVHVWLSNGNGTFRVNTFKPWNGYAMPNGLWVAGDYNGDGRTDLVHVVNRTDYVHVWLSRGNGTFQVGTFRPWGGYAMPNGLWVAGDYNGDRKDDLVHVVSGTDYVHVWTSLGNGRFRVGTYRPWSGYAMPNGPWLAGDFNNDGKTDLVHVVNRTDYVHVWTSLGNGRFRVGTYRPWSGYAMPNGPWLTGDHNGDGLTDLIHIVNRTDYIHVWTSRGNGTFRVGTYRPWRGYAMPNGVWLSGDFDRDGKDDLVHAVARRDYAHTWISRGNGTYNVGTFSAWRGYAIPNGLWLNGDITGDRKSDIMHIVNRTDYIHPWISTLPAPGQMSVDGIEVTQTVQNMDHAVPVLADKRTVVRAYVSSNTSGSVTVRGQLQVQRGSLFTTLNSMNAVTVNPAQNGQLRPKRENVTGGLNFPLPAHLDNAGTKSFRVVTLRDASTGTTKSCSDCRNTRRNVRFINSPPLRVTIIGLRYTTGSPPRSYIPATTDFNLIRSWLRRAYPVPSVIWRNRIVPASNTWPFTCGQSNAQVANIRAQDVNGGTADRRTHYYGLVHDGGGFMRGCSAVPSSPNPAAISSGPTGSGSWGWDTDGSYGDWYTGHELGHSFGRHHPGSGCGESSSDPSYPFSNGQLSGSDGAFVGFDAGDAGSGIGMAALPGVQWHDVMTYCQRQWLSSYNYTGIRARLVAEQPLGPGAPAPGLEAEPAAAVETAVSEARQPEFAAPSLESAPEIIQEQAKPGETVTGERPFMGEPTPSAHLPQIPDAAQPEGFQDPAAEMESAPPVRYAPVGAMPPAEIEAADAPPVGLEAAESVANETLKTGDFLSVIGIVNLTRNTGKIEYVSRVSKALVPITVQSDRARIRLVGEGGDMLGDYAVPILQNTETLPGEDQTGVVNGVIPYATGVGRMELLLSGKLVDMRQVSKAAPDVESVSTPMAPEAVVDPTAPIVVSWQARDADSDQLTYTVQMSRDDGATWETIAVGMSDTRIDIDRSQLEGLDAIKVRVIASDGFNSATLTSETISLKQ